jgi:regulator of replication initiation timing
MSNEHNKTTEELQERINVLLNENEKLRAERNNLHDELGKYVDKFIEMRSKFEKLAEEVNFLMSVAKKK